MFKLKRIVSQCGLAWLVMGAWISLLASKPNIVLFTFDDWRYLAKSLGDSHMVTPNVNALAKSGVTFKSAYCTQALCPPSRTAMVTGKRAPTTGVVDYLDRFRDTIPEARTLGQHFMEHGYHVLGFGKTYLHWRDDLSWSEEVRVPFVRYGVPIYALENNLQAQRDAIASGLETKTSAWWAGDTWWNPTAAWESADVPDNYYYDGKIAELAIERIIRLKQDEPFFLHVGFFGPHYPHIAPQKYFELYDFESIKVPDRSLPEGMWPGASDANAPEDDFELRQLIHAYFAQVSYVDALFGQVMEALKEAALFDDSIIVLTSDHGHHLGERSHWTKQTNFEVDMKVPLFVKLHGPDTREVEVDQFVELVDLYPTFCDLAGLPRPNDLEGISFTPLFADPHRTWKTAVFHEKIRDGYYGSAIRTKHHRLVQWRKGSELFEELYDLHLDGWPYEQRNLIKDPNYVSVAQDLRDRLAVGWKGEVPPE